MDKAISKVCLQLLLMLQEFFHFFVLCTFWVIFCCYHRTSLGETVCFHKEIMILSSYLWVQRPWVVVIIYLLSECLWYYFDESSLLVIHCTSGRYDSIYLTVQLNLCISFITRNCIRKSKLQLSQNEAVSLHFTNSNKSGSSLVFVSLNYVPDGV